MRVLDGKYIKRGSIGGTVIKCALSEAILFDSIDEALSCYFDTSERYGWISWDKRSENLKIVRVNANDDFFRTRRMKDRVDILINQVYRIDYKLSNNENYSTTETIRINKVMSHKDIILKDAKEDRYNNIELVRQLAQTDLKRMKGSRQLEDFIGTIHEGDIERLSLEKAGQFVITNVELIENIII
ncbi:hypothetical protein [Paenibacillus dendrobii]|uniref:hypothetical protein n=1 Tax=Paenibacillus dendrobii TaxID=2691084 RepID=UPI00136BC619|nr:hypothetical protein [Paenibacillus dendrobii]